MTLTLHCRACASRIRSGAVTLASIQVFTMTFWPMCIYIANLHRFLLK